MYATIQPLVLPLLPSQPQQLQQQQQQHSRQGSYADSIRSAASSSISRQSPAPSLTNNYQPKPTTIAAQQQPKQDDKVSHRTSSIASSSRRSSEKFPPPPPPNLEVLDLSGAGGEIYKPRSLTSTSTRSSAYADINEVNRNLTF
jgi:hypothetical protein